MRHATEADLAAIVAIYNSTVPTRQSTADTQEVSVESRREWFRQHTPDRRPLLVHEIQNRIVAWVSFQSFRGRPAYDYTAEISIYIAPQYRGQGLGRQLLMEAIAMTPALGRKTLVGFVLSHNEPSIRLLRSCGFDEWGKLPNIAEMDGKEYSLSILGKRINHAGENQNRHPISVCKTWANHVLKMHSERNRGSPAVALASERPNDVSGNATK